MNIESFFIRSCSESRQIYKRLTLLLLSAFVLTLFTLPAAAQGQEPYTPPPPPPPAQPQPEAQAPPPGPGLSPAQLDDLVKRIALYPDPLLAQILTASTYGNQIPEASDWANQHSGLKGDALADAIKEDNLQWDPSVIALLPFPSVLSMMAQDVQWTNQLGDAVLAQRPDVMDAVQRMRRQSYQYGYLRSNAYDNVVDADDDIEILPTNPAYVYVPTYDPFIVFAAPRPGFFIGAGIRFGPAIVIGPAFYPWGWAHPYFGWRAHGIFFDATPWGRGWVNRGYYVHPYAHPFAWRPGPRIEHHDFGHRR
jgi:hypothetical protein